MYRIRIPGGQTGYVFARSVETVREALSRRKAAAELPVRENPYQEAVTMEWIAPGEDYSVLGGHGDYWLVETEQGRTGWLEIPAAPNPSLSSP
jgi:hypothetical protein